MYKFRSEPWGKKVNHDLEWTTCYSDHINGYGHFHNKNDMHVRRPPRNSNYRPYVKTMTDPEPYKRPDTDHMWYVLHRKGPLNTLLGGNPAVRERLKKLLRDGQKQRLKRNASPPEEDPPKIPKVTSKAVDEKSSEKRQLDPIPEVGPLTPSEIQVDVRQTSRNPAISNGYDVHPDYQLPLWSRRQIESPKMDSSHVTDPVKLPVAGLPTVWNIYKPRHHMDNPPPYIPQPKPLPFSQKHNATPLPSIQERIALVPPRRPTAEAVTQTSPLPDRPTSPRPPTLRPLPDVSKSEPTHPTSNSRSRQPTINLCPVNKTGPTVLNRKKDLPPVTGRGKTGVDISWILDKQARQEAATRLKHLTQAKTIRSMYKNPWKPGMALRTK